MKTTNDWAFLSNDLDINCPNCGSQFWACSSDNEIDHPTASCCGECHTEIECPACHATLDVELESDIRYSVVDVKVDGQ